MNNNNYTHILDKITNTPWVIAPDSLQTILSILDRKMAGEEVEYAFGPVRPEANVNGESEPQSGVGVLPIIGPIFPKANMMTQMSGATSIEQLQTKFRAMVADPAITSIVLNIDSPGGMSDLIMEMGDEIYNARSQKPIVAVANTTAASAAYWLGSQADKLFVTPSGQVGSVGVYTVHQDKSAQQEKDGVKTTMISAGKFKVEGSPYAPLSDEAKTHMQERVDETYSEFISAVARGRGTSEEVVRETYADGRTYRAKSALTMGMVDGIETLDSMVGKMESFNVSNTTGTGVSYVSHTGTITFTSAIQTPEDEMEPLSPETLAALGLSEDATTEEIETAVTQMAAEIQPLRNAVSAERAFAEQYPEQARMLSELKARDTENSAKLFTDSYAQFSQDSTKGFSGVALEMITDMHKKISAGGFSHDDLKSFLDSFKEGNALVDYSEHGTSREREDNTANDPRDAASQIAQLAQVAIAEAGGPTKLSWGDAISQVSASNPELARLYQESVGGGE